MPGRPHAFLRNAPFLHFTRAALTFSAVLLLPWISMSRAQSSAIDGLIAEGAKPLLLAGGFKFTEGPAADAAGNLYFTDIGSNRIHYWNASNQSLSTIRENSGGADGLFVDRDGALWICELKDKLSENSSNITFGGADQRTLFVTANHGLYSLRMRVAGNVYNSPQETLFDAQDDIAGLVQAGAQLTQLATGFRIAQGPAVDARGDLSFSDLYHHRIMKWEFATASLNLVREQPGGPDGLFFEADGALLVCELTGRRFARLHPNGQYEIIAEQFEGTPLTGPNDVYVDKAGGIYFSDSYPGSQITHPPAHCVYYVAPGETKLQRIIDNHYKTKGIHLSPDGQWIYLADYGGRKVYRHRLLAPGRLGPPELFVDTRCGGLTIDEHGNVYLSTVDDYKGILVYAPDGRRLGQIRFPEATTNAVFAGPDRDQLIVTTFKSLYALPMSVKGMR